MAPVVGAIIAGWSFEAITGIDRSTDDITGVVNFSEVSVEVPRQTRHPALNRDRGVRVHVPSVITTGHRDGRDPRDR